MVKKFEQKRAELAYECGIKYEEMKPILTFHGVKQDKIKWIAENNYSNVNKGIIDFKNYYKHTKKKGYFVH